MRRHHATVSSTMFSSKPAWASLCFSSASLRLRIVSNRTARAWARPSSDSTTVLRFLHRVGRFCGRVTGQQTGFDADFVFDFLGDFRIVLQKLLRVFPALSKAHVAIGIPRAAAAYDAKLGRHVQNAAFF